MSETGASHERAFTLEGRGYVAVDLDATLTDAPYNPSTIPDPGIRGLQLLGLLKDAGYSVVLFSGRISERMTVPQRVMAVQAIQDWIVKHNLDKLIDRIWAWPKPHVMAFVDDRAVRWRGDPELVLTEVRNATSWVDALSEKKDGA